MEAHWRFGAFELDGARGILTRDGLPVPLGHRALGLLLALLRAGGQVVTKDELLAAAWPGMVVEEANLSVQIAGLRKVLASSPPARDWIATVPRVGYRYTGPIRPACTPAPAGSEPGGMPDTPTLAVLPFASLGGEARLDTLADSISEDILDALSHYRWFRVVARSASRALRGQAGAAKQLAREFGVRYVLEGSVRRSGKRIRIAAALSDVHHANQLWADRFEFALTDVFSAQDRIVQRVAGALEPELLKLDAGSLTAGGPATPAGARGLIRQGVHAFHQVERTSHWHARAAFREAIAREPGLPEAHVWLARAAAGIVAYGWSADPQADLREGLAAAFEAIRLDERSPYAHYALAITSAYAGDPEQSARAARRALEINPSFALGHLVLGMALLFAGRTQPAIDALEHGLELNAFDPQNFVWYSLLSVAQHLVGRFDLARQAAERACGIRPGWHLGLELTAACHAALGHAEAAARCMQQLRDLPAPTHQILAPLQRAHPHWQSALDLALPARTLSPTPRSPRRGSTAPAPPTRPPRRR